MKQCKWIWLSGIVVLLILAAQPVLAVTDYVFFSVYGDTTINVAVHGDSIGFGANCEIGATIAWQIWLDADSNETTGDLGDKIFLSFTSTDGDTIGLGGPNDINPVPDGWFVSPSFILGFAPGHYILVGTDMSDLTSAEKAFSMTVLASPPNTFTGTVTIEGIIAPDPLLSNIWIQAETEGTGFQLWSALTDASGYYEIGMTDEATGLPFRISPEMLPGYATPPPQYLWASGLVPNVDFAYAAPIDSVYGYLVDENDDPILTARVYCSQQSGGEEKSYDVTDGSYVIYFGPGELGEWWLGLSSDFIVPDYMVPQSIPFDNSTIHDLRHDFVCYSTDTVVYAKITEAGGPPTHQYLVIASSEALQSQTEGVSGTGADNIIPLHVSSLDAIYQVGVSSWDNRYPIPAGYVIEGNQSKAVGLGDTAEINLVLGYMVRDTIKVLPPDNIISWSQVSVNFSGPGSNVNVNPDNDGVYTAYLGPGMYNVNVWHNSFLALPQYRTVEVTGDTVGGMGFTLNYTHCHVTGHITGLPLPIDTGYYVSGFSGSDPNVYNVGGRVESDGSFGFYVCDGSWQFSPPNIPNTHMPSPVPINIGGLDPAFDFDFNYAPMMLVGGTVMVDPDDPPVNWNNVQVRLNGSGSYQVAPDNDGNFAIYADTGMYMLDAYYVNYLTTPGGYFNIHLLEDTTAGLDFLLNVRDIRVHGHILGIPLPIPGGPYNVTGGTDTYPLGYHVSSPQIDNATGAYEISVCDGNWTFNPPDIPGYATPLPRYMELNETDTVAGYDFSYLVSSVDDPGFPAIPREFSLSQNSPNPFNMATRIDFDLPQSSEIELAVYNILGQKVQTLAEGTYPAGTHSARWDGSDESGTTAASGIYFYRLIAGDKVLIKKMLVLK